MTVSSETIYMIEEFYPWGYSRPLKTKTDQIFDFRDSLFGQVKKMPYVWKKLHRNERYLCLVTHIFTKLSQNICLINILILIYGHARCYCNLWQIRWFYWVFWVFSYIIDDYSCLICCISIHQTFTDCVPNWYTHFEISACQMWLKIIEGSVI